MVMEQLLKNISISKQGKFHMTLKFQYENSKNLSQRRYQRCRLKFICKDDPWNIFKNSKKLVADFSIRV